jgi:gamma-F420-2:alpha-L-glutamate ligase
MIEGWLLYTREDYAINRFFANNLIAGGAEHGLGIELRFTDEIHAGIQSGLPCVTAAAGAVSPAFVLNRARCWLLARCLELQGIRVFNTSEAARICNDKMESHLLAAKLGLPQVDMRFCPNTPEGLANHGLCYPVVIKNPYGHGGSEVALANGEEELLAAAARMSCDKVIVQRLSGRPGEDVRVYALGGEILTAVKRRAVSGFRANLSLGGAVEPYTLDDAGRRMAERLLQALWLDYAGIDFILDEKGGLLFNELEDAVGSRSLYRLGSHDAAGLYLDYISKTMGSIKT